MASRNGSEVLREEPLPLPGTPQHQQRLQRIAEYQDAWYAHFSPSAPDLRNSEWQHIREGDPYCFLCGKPASAFPEYSDSWIDSEATFTGRADYVRREEGTYNPETNRFACDECYIRIGMPTRPGGWKAP